MNAGSPLQEHHMALTAELPFQPQNTSFFILITILPSFLPENAS